MARKLHLPGGGSALALFLLVATPALAGDELGISDAGSTLAEAFAMLGAVMVVAGIVIVGILMTTSFFLALTAGGALMAGGAIMANAEDVANALFQADMGGASVVYYTGPGPVADVGPATFDPTTATASLAAEG